MAQNSRRNLSIGKILLYITVVQLENILQEYRWTVSKSTIKRNLQSDYKNQEQDPTDGIKNHFPPRMKRKEEWLPTEQDPLYLLMT